MEGGKDLVFKELYNGSEITSRLKPNEAYAFHNVVPLLNKERTLREFGIDAEILAGIRAGQKDFLVCSLATTATAKDGGKIVFPGSQYTYDADFLLIDESFGEDTEQGHKGIRFGELPFTIGRSYLPDRFNYPETTSRNHFVIGTNDEGDVVIQNLEPINGTVLFYRGEITTRNDLNPTSATLDTIGGAEQLPFLLHVGLAEYSDKGDKSEDRYLARTADSLFAVFDGAGGESNAAQAAEKARLSLAGSFIEPVLLDSPKELATAERRLKVAMQQASVLVSENVKGGITTCTSVRLVSVLEGVTYGPYAIWASAGDSRIYVYHDGIVTQLSADEGQENKISNYLGQSKQGRLGEVQQSGHQRMQIGDKILLVTDGITGDSGAQLLSEVDLATACAKATPQAIAEELIRISRKRDDKTALVISITDRVSLPLNQALAEKE